MTGSPKIAILSPANGTPVPVINALAQTFADHLLFIEDPESKTVFLKRRARKIGWLATAHQFPVMVLGKFAKRFAVRRYADIEQTYGVRFTLDPGVKTADVGNANSARFYQAMADFAPDLLVVIGARLLTKKTLKAMPCPVINFHAGINPKYRGLNGGYWSVVTGDTANYGTTVHYIDTGVDTGDVIAQARFEPDRRDTILTHQHAMTAQSVPMVIDAVHDVLAGKAQPHMPDLPSMQWYHPGLTGYIWTGLTKRHW